MSSANWLAMAKAEAGLRGIPIKAGEGFVCAITPWNVVVELRSPGDRSLIARFDRTQGRWEIH
jgi:hypothetical protein